MLLGRASSDRVSMTILARTFWTDRPDGFAHSLGIPTDQLDDLHARQRVVGLLASHLEFVHFNQTRLGVHEAPVFQRSGDLDPHEPFGLVVALLFFEVQAPLAMSPCQPIATPRPACPRTQLPWGSGYGSHDGLDHGLKGADVTDSAGDHLRSVVELDRSGRGIERPTKPECRAEPPLRDVQERVIDRQIAQEPFPLIRDCTSILSPCQALDSDEWIEKSTAPATFAAGLASLVRRAALGLLVVAFSWRRVGLDLRLVDAPRLDAIVDGGLIVARQRHPPRLRVVGDVVLLGDRQAVSRAGGGGVGSRFGSRRQRRSPGRRGGSENASPGFEDAFEYLPRCR